MDDRGRMTEVGGQRSEVGRQRSEVGGRRSGIKHRVRIILRIILCKLLSKVFLSRALNTAR